MLRAVRQERLGWSVYLLPLFFGFLFTPSASQTGSGLDGVVTTTGGQPAAGVSVYGSASKTCCPFKSENTTTDENGRFHLEHPGAVVHFSKDGFEPQALVIPAGTPQVQVALSPPGNDLIAPPCGARQPGSKRIGWRVRFDLPRHAVRILGGKTDVDYVRYLIKPKAGDAYLELWFGPYALSTEPDDEDFLSSIEFSQRRIVTPGLGVVGTDTRGQHRDREKWRQTAIAGGGGARYKATGSEDVILFDQVVNSICMVPFENEPSTKQSNSQPKP
jgi:hypothetical protein